MGFQELYVFFGADAEAYAEGECGEFTEFGELIGDLRGQGGSGPGDAGDADDVKETRAGLGDLVSTFQGSGGSDQLNEGELAGCCLGSEDLSFFMWKIGNDQAAKACITGGIEKVLYAFAEDDAVADHGQERRVLVFLRPCFGMGKDVSQFCFGIEGTGVAGLDDGAISEGVAVGDADLDDVGTGFYEGIDDQTRRVQRRVTGGDERNESRCMFGTAFLEYIIQQGHYWGTLRV